MLLALDLDDTLLDADKQVSPANLAALECWLASGHEIVVATGRPPRSVAPVLPPLLQNAPRIVYNGAQAIVDGRVVYANPLPAPAVMQMLAWTAQSGVEWWIGLEIEDHLYVNRHFAKPDPFTVADLHEMCAHPVSKMIFFFPNGRGDIAPLLAAVPEGARALVTPKFSVVQLCARTADKAEALRHLLRPRGLTMDAVIAIGDDINDEPVFEAAPEDWLTVRVGRPDHGESRARYWLASPADMVTLLDHLLLLHGALQEPAAQAGARSPGRR